MVAWRTASIFGTARRLALGAAIVAAAASAGVAAPAPDLVLVNGKVVTVDQRFRIVEGVAVAAGRVLAVGTSAEMRRLAGPATRILDLRRRTVIPGLIDNHAHYLRAAEYWHREVRLDGVTSRAKALALLKAKAEASAPGEWVLSLGGWSEQQFTDDRRPFTKDELDRIAPANPVLLQLLYTRVYANGRALEALGLDPTTAPPPGARLLKTADGALSGVIDGGAGVRMALGHLPKTAPEQRLANAHALMRDLNAMGLTAVIDYGGRDFSEAFYAPFAALADRHELTLRVFHALWQEPDKPDAVDAAIARIRAMKPFQGDAFYDEIGYGETVYFPLHDNLLAPRAEPSPEAMALWRRIAGAVAEQGLHLNVHATLKGSIGAFLDAIEDINRVRPIKGLRWTFSHIDQAEAGDLERMRRLGMYAEIHSRPTIEGELMHGVHGDRADAMPPLALVAASGLPWGLGSDATVVTPANPFFTLWWAATGKMLNGKVVTRPAIDRVTALVAHTRANAYFAFQEANIGAIEPGKAADLLILDRDYLTVPADEIKAIRPVMTIVGGRIVYEREEHRRQ